MTTDVSTLKDNKYVIQLPIITRHYYSTSIYLRIRNRQQVGKL